MNDPIAILKTRLIGPPDLTQAELASLIGISPQFLSEILNGKRNPSQTVLNFLGLEKVVSYRPQHTEDTVGKTRVRRRA